MPTRNGVVSAKPATSDRSEAEPRSVRLLVHEMWWTTPYGVGMEIGRRLPKTMTPLAPSFHGFGWDDTRRREASPSTGGRGDDTAGRFQWIREYSGKERWGKKAWAPLMSGIATLFEMLTPMFNEAETSGVVNVTSLLN
uniref:Uncharacterized protein n=1 Tax=Oryza meridionalis TaxID=40149 RepID=A0A0E0D7H0_9ORYZ